MRNITQNLVIDTSNADEFEVHKWVTEASDLGLPVSVFPKHLKTVLGNKQDFVAFHEEVRDGDCLWVDYQQANGCLTLRIFND